MKQKKRWICRWLSALLVTILVLASLAGCGQRTEAKKNTAAAATRLAVTATETVLDRAEESSLDQEPELELTVEEDGTYTSKEEVALYLHTYGKLPSNYITKKEAEALGWKREQGHAGDLDVVAPGKSIGGSHFGNYEEQLPEKKGRKYYECDINYQGGSRGAERIIYSDDGLIFYTGDHYKTFEQLYPEER